MFCLKNIVIFLIFSGVSNKMAQWQDVILYTFLSYILLHLIIDDVLLIFTYIRNNTLQVNNTEIQAEQRTIVKIISKICDVVCQCVLKYLEIFGICWNKSVECLQITMCEYIKFLDSLSKTLLMYPTCIFTCISACVVSAVACIIVWILFE